MIFFYDDFSFTLHKPGLLILSSNFCFNPSAQAPAIPKMKASGEPVTIHGQNITAGSGSSSHISNILMTVAGDDIRRTERNGDDALSADALSVNKRGNNIYLLNDYAIRYTSDPDTNVYGWSDKGISFTTDLTCITFKWRTGIDGINFADIVVSDPFYPGGNNKTLHILTAPSLNYAGSTNDFPMTRPGKTFTLRFANLWRSDVRSKWRNDANRRCGVYYYFSYKSIFHNLYH
jgi:hypothetical protein